MAWYQLKYVNKTHAIFTLSTASKHCTQHQNVHVDYNVTFVIDLKTYIVSAP